MYVTGVVEILIINQIVPTIQYHSLVLALYAPIIIAGITLVLYVTFFAVHYILHNGIQKHLFDSIGIPNKMSQFTIV